MSERTRVHVSDRCYSCGRPAPVTETPTWCYACAPLFQKSRDVRGRSYAGHVVKMGRYFFTGYRSHGRVWSKGDWSEDQYEAFVFKDLSFARRAAEFLQARYLTSEPIEAASVVLYVEA